MKIEDDQGIIVYDLEGGDFLPDCNDTVCNVKVGRPRDDR